MATKKSPRKKPVKDKSLVVVQCKANAGKTPCLQRALAAELLMEALASTVWYHRDDDQNSVEFVVADSGIVPTGKTKGHFEIGVSVTRLDKSVHDDDMLEMTLHKFLQTFTPARTINAQDCQA